MANEPVQGEHLDVEEVRGGETGSSCGLQAMVFALTERDDRTFWTKIGVAYANRDGSITCKLDALPVSGTLQIRDEESRNERNQEQERDR
jgi:hypothetical protein